MLNKITTIALTISFFAFGNFGLLNIFDIRREVQSLILMLLSIHFLYNLFNGERSYFKQPIFYLAVSLFISTIVLDDWELTRIYFAVLLIIVCIYDLPKSYQEMVLKYIISLTALFSVFALVQVVFVLLEPAFIYNFDTGYHSASGAEALNIKHPLGYLGFTYNDYELFIMNTRFTRFISYSTEASILVPYFFIPGILALTMEPKYVKFSIPILFYVCIFPFSTTIQMTLMIGCLLAVIIKLAPQYKHYPKLLYFSPFILSLLLFMLYKTFSSIDIMDYFQNYFNPLAESSSAFDKQGSGLGRLIGMSTYLNELRVSILGYDARVSAPMNIIVSNYISGGIAAFICTSMIIYQISKACVQGIMQDGVLIKIAGIMGFASLLVMLTFSDYGWRIAPGFIMLIFMELHFVKITLKEL